MCKQHAVAITHTLPTTVDVDTLRESLPHNRVKGPGSLLLKATANSTEDFISRCEHYANDANRRVFGGIEGSRAELHNRRDLAQTLQNLKRTPLLITFDWIASAIICVGLRPYVYNPLTPLLP